MKAKLGKFLEITGIIMALVIIASFVTLALKNMIVYAVLTLILGFMADVIFFALAQMLYSVSNIESDIEDIAERVSLIEERNRETMEKEFFSNNSASKGYKKTAAQSRNTATQKRQTTLNTNTQKSNFQSTNAQSTNARSTTNATCIKCGYTALFSGSNICSRCGNHSFYQND